MLRFYELIPLLTKLGFCATFIINMLFINLTIFHTKVVTGTYRKMLVLFAATCIVYTAIEIIVQPCLHDFNGGAICFSLVEDSVFSQRFLRVALIVYASCYVAQLVFIAIQFLFRYSILVQHPLRESFKGQKQILWVLCYIGTGIFYGSLAAVCLEPNDYSDEYMREEMFNVYGRYIEDTPRVIAVAYENGAILWRTVIFLIFLRFHYHLFSGSTIIGVQYVIIIYCTLRMQDAMNTRLKNLSTRNRTLERQFFKALTVQILLPTILLTVPVGFVLSVPLLDIRLSCQGGMINVLYSVYSPLDCIATMVIVDEYKKCLKKLMRDIGELLNIKRRRVRNGKTMKHVGVV